MSKNILDHHQAFEVLFQCCQIDKFFEFGLGAGTEYFLKHCHHVTSVELAIDNNTKWFDRCKSGYRNYNNWDTHFYILPDNICKAEHAIRLGTSQTVYNTAYTYLEDLQKVICQFVPSENFDLVFVDAGIHLRADIVNILFGRVKIIVAHDTKQLPDYYGWNRINIPHDYKRIDFPTHAGVTFWIYHTQSEVIHHLQGELKSYESIT